jgi:hypothetical protein
MVSRDQSKRIKDFVDGFELLDGQALEKYIERELEWLRNESGYSKKSICPITSMYRGKIANSSLPEEKKEIGISKFNLTAEEWNVPKLANIVKTETHARNTITINPEPLILKAREMLKSNKHTVQAAGLIFLSGRRPGEIVKTANFEKVNDSHLMFSGQIKDRGLKTKSYEIPCLIETDVFLEAFKKFRENKQIVDLAKEEDLSKIDSRFNSSIRYQIRQNFDELSPTYQQKQISCDNLRSAYATIATKYYCPNSVVDILYYGDILGHNIPKEVEQDEKARLNYATTLSYFDYKVASEPDKPVESKVVKTSKSKRKLNVTEITAELMNQWKFSDEEKEMVDSVIADKGIPPHEFIKHAVLAEAKRRWTLGQKSAVAMNIDSESLKPSDGKGAPRYKGVTEIKLKRAFEAIMAWNDSQEHLEKKWAITVNGLKKLTGTKHETISTFIKENLETIQKHHEKHQIDERRHNTFRGRQGDKIDVDVNW